MLKETVKSKLEQTVLPHLTPEGNLLDLEKKNIGPEELRLLCEAGKELEAVKQVYISDNELGSAEIEILCQSRCFPT